MIHKEKYLNNISKTISIFKDILLSEPILLCKNLKKIPNRKKVFKILILFSVFISLFSFFLYIDFSKSIIYTKYTEQNSISNVGGDILDPENSVVINNFIGIYDNCLKLLKPLFDNFISNTPDVTSNTRIIFSDNTSILSAQNFYEKSYDISLFIFIILISCLGLNFILNPEDIRYKDTFLRFLSVLFFLIAGKSLMGVSISITNALNNYFLSSNSNLTEYLTNISQIIKNSVPQSNTNPFVGMLKTAFTLGFTDIISFVQSLPVILPFILILLILFFITIQFITRFIILYFLYVVQPISAVFLLNRETESINKNFWRMWITFLIQQPIFLLAFSLIQNILIDTLKNGISFVSIIIFLVSLIFLSSISTVISRVFTDIWNHSYEYIQNKTNIYSAFGRYMPLGKNFHSLKFNTNQRNFIPSKSFDPVKSINTDLGFITPHVKLRNPLGSRIAQTLKHENIDIHPTDITSPSNGVLNVSGDFYRYKDSSGISTLYTSLNNGLKDGLEESKLKKVSLKNLNFIDSSNRIETHRFNRDIASISKYSYLKGSGYSDPQTIKNGLNSTKDINTSKNIHGAMISRYSEPLKDFTGQDRNVKIYIYDDFLDDNE